MSMNGDKRKTKVLEGYSKVLQNRRRRKKRLPRRQAGRPEEK